MRGLGLNYVREFSSKLTSSNRSTAPSTGPSVPSATTSSSSSPSMTVSGPGASESEAVERTPRPASQGDKFLTSQLDSYACALARHMQLIASGERLMEQLGSTRRRLVDQIESEQFIRQNFSQVATLRTQLAAMRMLVKKIADDIEDVEVLLVEKTEEYMAAQNASFAARQQQELEVFEAQMLASKEAKRRELLDERREKLAQAFRNDLKTYQALVSYQGESTSKATQPTDARMLHQVETLESVDLIVTADDSSLQAFYQTDSESDEEVEQESESNANKPSKLVQEEEDSETLKSTSKPPQTTNAHATESSALKERNDEKT